MTQLLSEYENNGINARVVKTHDEKFQVLVFNLNSGQELAKFFNSYTEATKYAESSTHQQLNG